MWLPALQEGNIGAKYANAGAGRDPAARGAAGKPAGYPSRAGCVMSYLRESLARHAQYSVGGKNITLTLRPSSLVVVADAEGFWRRRWAMCWTMPSTLRLKMALSH